MTLEGASSLYNRGDGKPASSGYRKGSIEFNGSLFTQGEVVAI